MKYLEAFRDSHAAAALTAKIADVARQIGVPLRIMEVCGTHTMAIARYGLRSLLPANVDMVSGPGCPVCVTDCGYIDAAIALAEKGVTVATFGDMLKVPGTNSSLAECRSAGATIAVCYSPLEALKLAEADPAAEVVFLAVGFETTIAPVISLVPYAIAQEIRNVSLLTAFKTVPNALRILASHPAQKIDAFLCPAHVSAIIGADAYEPIVREFRLPAVIGGFEPLDMLQALLHILQQVRDKAPRVENLYARVVRAEGNRKAQALIERYLEPADVSWRGLGILPESGLVLRPAYAAFDAEKKHGIKILPGVSRAGCRCKDVLWGMIKPPECALFGNKCTPENPVGPCMVSSEGTCSAYYTYQDRGANP